MEAAFAVASLIAVLVLSVGAVVGVTAHVRCVDAAREAARLSARGDDARVAKAVSEVGPPGATSTVSRDGDTVTVVVRAPVALLPGLTVSASAVAAVEPGTAR
ncbi:pilus biosynthesis protein TadE [Tsukamurella tyrosinosolvens]|uniref:TadE family type IV pilus minor pilin n=1 Tax=Tsukamurella tyrosinosolvens TaxID=57704 RepID=UPI0007922B33|nr:TadE family type IV pilus minor pilin [Tsukamurella tyrosinosolvens]KXP07649.1 pilus biosynthesis protein TadE [Tsukamurella tyrosinosolvens]KZL98852.1 pilus biosynthesis protein TadE [Tsukamurella tyrosinosolvens]MCA4995082.1 pilus biosynthesis protein TadE [Tsukamurella tyrosinosolvens]